MNRSNHRLTFPPARNSRSARLEVEADSGTRAVREDHKGFDRVKFNRLNLVCRGNKVRGRQGPSECRHGSENARRRSTRSSPAENRTC